MSNAPFTDNLSKEDFAIFQTYVQVQAVAMTAARKENAELRAENARLKRQQYRDMTTEQIYASIAKGREGEVPDAVKNFVIYALNHESGHFKVLYRELRDRIAKLEETDWAEWARRQSHEYEGSERWSPENGDEVYRDGKWVTITESKHPDDDEQLIAEAQQYYNLDERTWLNLSKIAQVALMQHYNKEV